MQLQRAITPTHILGSTGTSNVSDLGYASIENIKELLGISDVQDAIQALSDKIDELTELFTQANAEQIQANLEHSGKIDELTALTGEGFALTGERFAEVFVGIQSVSEQNATLTDLAIGEIDPNRILVDRLIARRDMIQSKITQFRTTLEDAEAVLNSLETQLGNRTLETAANELEVRIDNLGG